MLDLLYHSAEYELDQLDFDDIDSHQFDTERDTPETGEKLFGNNPCYQLLTFLYSIQIHNSDYNAGKYICM